MKPGELESQVAIYRALGFRELHREDMLGSDQVREVLLQIGDSANRVQLLEPLNANSPVARQLEKNGNRGGIAHIAYRVRDIYRTYADVQAQGLEVIDRAPRPGSGGTTVFFIHPRSLGYLIEVVGEGGSGV